MAAGPELSVSNLDLTEICMCFWGRFKKNHTYTDFTSSVYVTVKCLFKIYKNTNHTENHNDPQKHSDSSLIVYVFLRTLINNSTHVLTTLFQRPINLKPQ